MKDDDLLFGVDDLNRWKWREFPQDWMADRQRSLLERLRQRVTELKTTTASTPTNKPCLTAPTAPPQPCGRSSSPARSSPEPAEIGDGQRIADGLEAGPASERGLPRLVSA